MTRKYYNSQKDEDQRFGDQVRARRTKSMMHQYRDNLLKIAYERYRSQVIASGGKATAEVVFANGFLSGWDGRSQALNRNKPKWAKRD
jgi:hypothetical protein